MSSPDTYTGEWRLMLRDDMPIILFGVPPTCSLRPTARDYRMVAAGSLEACETAGRLLGLPAFVEHRNRFGALTYRSTYND